MVLLGLAGAAALIGLWAQLAPLSFHADFPGLRRFWISLDGPFNEHLIRDVGGHNLALAALTASAAFGGPTGAARLAAVCWLIYGVPYFAYHATHLGPFEAIDAVAQVVALALQVAAPLWILFTTSARRSAAHTSAPGSGLSPERSRTRLIQTCCTWPCMELGPTGHVQVIPTKGTSWPVIARTH